jgi:hypothetical protein
MFLVSSKLLTSAMFNVTSLTPSPEKFVLKKSKYV